MMHTRALQTTLQLSRPALCMQGSLTSCSARKSLHTSAGNLLQSCIHAHQNQLPRLHSSCHARDRCTSSSWHFRSNSALSARSRAFSSSPSRQVRDEDPCECMHPAWPTLSGAEAIDYSGHLVKIKPFARHVLIETPSRGSFDWTPRDELGGASLSGALNDALAPSGSRPGAETESKRVLGGRVLLNRSATTLQVDHPANAVYGDVKVFPEGVKLRLDLSCLSAAEAVDLLHVPDVFAKARALGVEAGYLEQPQFFVCGHMARDVRCGKTAGVLHAAISRHLAARGVPAEAGFVDHIGGHKYAGNLLCYLPQKHAKGRRYSGVWYGRVHLDNLESVLDETLAGRVVEDMVRVRL